MSGSERWTRAICWIVALAAISAANPRPEPHVSGPMPIGAATRATSAARAVVPASMLSADLASAGRDASLR